MAIVSETLNRVNTITMLLFVITVNNHFSTLHLIFNSIKFNFIHFLIQEKYAANNFLRIFMIAIKD